MWREEEGEGRMREGSKSKNEEGGKEEGGRGEKGKKEDEIRGKKHLPFLCSN